MSGLLNIITEHKVFLDLLKRTNADVLISVSLISDLDSMVVVLEPEVIKSIAFLGLPFRISVLSMGAGEDE
jgi:uncharacterized protein (UPF0371 family)